MGPGAAIVVIVVVVTVTLSGVHSAALDGNAFHWGNPTWSAYAQLTKRNAVQLCGTRLVEAVRGLCKGGLFTGYHRRSETAQSGGFNPDESHDDLREPSSNSVLDMMGSDSMYTQYGPVLDSYWDKDTDNSLSDLELVWPPTHSPNSKSLAIKVLTENKGHQRFRRNIIDECCKKSCSINDMVKYCGNQRRITLY